jgi:hypothetical protein
MTRQCIKKMSKAAPAQMAADTRKDLAVKIGWVYLDRSAVNTAAERRQLKWRMHTATKLESACFILLSYPSLFCVRFDIRAFPPTVPVYSFLLYTH